MSNAAITIQVDDDCFGEEGVAFADWCERRGYDVRRISLVSGCHPEHPHMTELWNDFCSGNQRRKHRRDY